MVTTQIAVLQRGKLYMSNRTFTKFFLNSQNELFITSINAVSTLQNTFVGKIGTVQRITDVLLLCIILQ